ncbi:hypothetical protein D0T25_28030 [Duganella sp. BJB488]|uniref:transposase n=1 Tax=unclassified Duganella TaxID=2636909 RepID=UPI000E355BB9|nr:MULTISPECIES: transposase [unclassified Duganella]RFP14295.1 hypothetical protein D0T25_28030 [Duganella sp. BJB488]RFP30231.1 hypothetical protein D0T24_28725 [Duganella sp. BJB480]
MLFCGIDLHSNNCLVVVSDDADKVVYSKRLPNDLAAICAALSPYQKELFGVVVESTYNWYWLVDGLMAAGHSLHLANTTAIKQYDGLKHRGSTRAIDKYAFQLSALLKTEAAKSRKQRRTLKQIHEDLKELGFEGCYDRVAAFTRTRRKGQTERVNPASKRTRYYAGRSGASCILATCSRSSRMRSCQ